MIGSLSGTLIRKTPGTLLVDVGGVGYEVTVSLTNFSHLPAEGEKVSLQIYTAVREDAIQLYGFRSREEKEIFLKLISISGIGPRLAMNILSGISPFDLATAITGQDVARLATIPGIGRKTAERLVVELKDKLKVPGIEITARPGDRRGPLYEDLLSALLNLGYKRPFVEGALVKMKWGDGLTFEGALKETLKTLSLHG